jgi:hypothetical protein
MKNLFIALLICCATTTGKSQENKNIFNDFMNDIVFMQIQNNLEVNYPLIIASPTFFGMANVKYINEKMLFSEFSQETDELIDYSSLNRKALFTKLKLEFIPEFKRDTTIQLQARLKNNLLYTLTFKKENSKESVILISPDNDFKTEVTYVKGQFESMTITTPDDVILNAREKENDGPLRKIIYHSKDQTYSITEDFYRNNFLIKKIYYKQTKDKNNKSVKRTANYCYDNSGRIMSETERNKKGTVIDSTNYTYEGTQLVSIMSYNDIARKQINFRYTDNHISNYIFKSRSNTIEIVYNYGKNDQINSLRVNDQSKSFIENYDFEYNSASKLVAIKNYRTGRDSKEITFKNQYIFSYFDSQVIKSMIVANEKGNILKEVKYEMNYLSKK